MVYDCFMFNGEFELLEIRLATHWDVIDKFVIVEGNRTFRGQDKEYSLSYFSALSPMKIKTIFFDVPVFKEPEGAWLACALQRDSMIRGLDECNADDLIIFSEIDEILRPEKIAEAQNLIISGVESVVFDLEMFCYYLNVRDSVPWDGARMLKFDTILRRKLSPQIIRNDECFDKEKSVRLLKSGWHFQNIGGPERVIKKLKASCHHELGAEKYSNLEIATQKIENLIEPLAREDHKLTVVEIDETFPGCVYKEQEKYKHLIWRKQ
jgi:hypothetical protein